MKKEMMGLLTTGLLLTGCTSASTAAASATADASADASAAATVAASALGYNKIVVGLDDTFAPMGFRDDSGNLTGFDVELAQAAGKVLGIEVEFQPIDWSLKETELNQGNIDCIWNGYSITEDRKQQVLFSDSYLENRQIIVVLADSAVASKADLAGKTVAVQKESSALEAVTADAEFTAALKSGAPVEYDTNNDCFTDLEQGRADAIVVDEVLARYVMKQKGEEKYKVLDDNFGTEQYAVGFRKSDTALCEAINGVLKQFQNDGTYSSIYAKWFSEN